MIIKKTHSIENWKSWDHEIHHAILAFHSHYSFYPNIMLASDITYNRINIAAKKEDVKNDKGEKPDPNMYINLSAFAYKDYHLDFCVDNNLGDKVFSLVYDSEPDGDGDGEPIPEDDALFDEYQHNVAVND
ncbi:MAG: hypothetical protein HQM16_09115 [Deltaproteobacteria bacterium]|nr:hypothetical protein [Deltaproteobacteria bacterium]